MKKYTTINQQSIDSWVNKYDLPWSKPISHEEYLRAKKGDYNLKLTPLKSVPTNWLNNIKDKKVLGLAAGGGQQMAILSALGANCTLLEVSKEQLEIDRKMSIQEGYQIELINGDMSEPFPFDNESFDLVINPISFHYIKEVKPVFKEIFRVLKKDGIFIGGFEKDINRVFDDNQIRIVRKLPFDPFSDKELYNELIEGDYGLQFSHTLEELIQGQIVAGLTIKEIYEDYNPSGNLYDKNIATFIATRAKK